MSVNAGNVLKINITTDPKDTILEYVQKYLNQSIESSGIKINKVLKPLIIVTPNAEQFVLASQNIQFAKMLNRADIAIPDGIGVVFAMRLFGKRHDSSQNASSIHRIAGVDFMQDLITIASKERITIGLMGGREGLAVKALECLQRTHLRLNGWAQDAPEFFMEHDELKIKKYDKKARDEYFSELVSHIEDTKARIVFVGLGAPKQEYIIEMLSSRLASLKLPVVLMSVGGSFDLISGSIQRAPQVIRMIGFEWAWRLAQEPWRWRRQTALFQFIWLLLKSSLHR